MTSIIGSRRTPARSAVGAWRALRPVERACVGIGVALIGSGLLHLAVFALDDRPWFGPMSWRKPVTFGLSFGATLLSIAWVTRCLRLVPRRRVVVLGVLAADSVVEVAGITLQAWRDEPSHFNTQSPFNTVVAVSLAAGGVVLVIVLGVLAIIAVRGHVDAPPSMRLALRGGFSLLVAGLLAGVAMIVRGSILRSTNGFAAAFDGAGFLKAFHGVTLHGVLVLPLLAWWLARRRISEQRRTAVVAAAFTAYVVAALAVLVESLALA